MPTPQPSYPEIVSAAEKLGLIARGGFHPSEADRVPRVFGDVEVGTLVLLGNAGPDMWAVVGAVVESSNARNPLDDWIKQHVGAMAAELGAVPLYPFGGPPFLPFLSWAERAEPVASSALGILIHADYGLWHAYRAALAFPVRFDVPRFGEVRRPCDSCVDKPCLNTCPVGAFSQERFDVASCGAHVAAPAGADCLGTGCRARRACPVGQGYAYAPEQARFHMAAFLGRNSN